MQLPNNVHGLEIYQDLGSCLDRGYATSGKISVYILIALQRQSKTNMSSSVERFLTSLIRFTQ